MFHCVMYSHNTVHKNYVPMDCHSFLVLSLISRPPGNEKFEWVHERFELEGFIQSYDFFKKS